MRGERFAPAYPYLFAELNDGLVEPITWYQFDRDMRRFSERYPGWLFTLTGEGEDRRDLWRAFYQDGKGYVRKASII
jgi:hypothetical protein